jgi:hypothetical protein
MSSAKLPLWKLF